MTKSSASGAEAEKLVAEVLVAEGFDVERVPTSTERRADLRARKGAEEFVVEVRTKTDDGSFDREVMRGAMPLDDRQIAFQSSIATVLRDKKQQLVATPTGAGAFRVVWFVALGRFAGTIVEQIESTFYGKVDIPSWGVRAPGAKTTRSPCYFFDHAQCYRMAEVVGVVVGDAREGRLLLNPCADGAERFAASSLVDAFRPSVVDPVAEEAAGKAYRADDFPGDRRDERAVRSFIESKYGREMMVPLRWKSVTVATRIASGR